MTIKTLDKTSRKFMDSGILDERYGVGCNTNLYNTFIITINVS